MENGSRVDQQIVENGFDPHGQAREMLGRYRPDRVGFGESIVFSGGVARNPCIVRMLKQRLDTAGIESPVAPDIVGALGAALYAGQAVQ